MDELNLSDFLVRDMQDADLAKIVQIEQAAQVNPWTRTAFEEVLARADAGAGDKAAAHHYCRVVVLHDQVVAFHVLSTVLDEAHILTLAVDTTVQGLGLGHLLMSDIEELALGESSAKVFLEVRASNSVAQSLYLKWQFVHTGVRKNYYKGFDLANSPENSRSSISSKQYVATAREDALIFMRTF